MAIVLQLQYSRGSGAFIFFTKGKGIAAPTAAFKKRQAIAKGALKQQEAFLPDNH
jgi:hypothetical protein